MRRVRTQVGIVGAGPAGLVLANVLHRAGIDTRLVERLPREAVERRARAGLLEYGVVGYLHAHGLADRLMAEGRRHGWCDFVCLGQRLRVDYAAHSGGAHHWAYPQQWLVRDLIDSLGRAGGAVHFAHPATAVEGLDTGRPLITCRGLELECDYVVGCDGPHGPARAALPAHLRRGLSHRYPYDWLTLLVETDRPVRGVLYGVHAQGFAGMMPRAGNLARVYLQVPPGDEADGWSEARVRRQLLARLEGAGPDLPRIARVRDSAVLRMRSTVVERLQQGRLFLAGDAAHVLTPSGAKGMNLAVDDAADLARALVRRYADGDHAELAGYTERRLRRTWHAQHFSDRLLRLLHLPPRHAGGDDARFALHLRLAQIRQLCEPGPHGSLFAHEYAGTPAAHAALAAPHPAPGHTP